MSKREKFFRGLIIAYVALGVGALIVFDTVALTHPFDLFSIFPFKALS